MITNTPTGVNLLDGRFTLNVRQARVSMDGMSWQHAMTYTSEPSNIDDFTTVFGHGWSASSNPYILYDGDDRRVAFSMNRWMEFVLDGGSYRAPLRVGCVGWTMAFGVWW